MDRPELVVSAEQLAVWDQMATPIYIYGLETHRHVWANSAGLDFFIATSLDEFTGRQLEPLSAELLARRRPDVEAMIRGERRAWTADFFPRGVPRHGRASVVAGTIDDEIVLVFEIWPVERPSRQANYELSGWAHSARAEWVVRRDGTILIQNPAADRLGPGLMPTPGQLGPLLRDVQGVLGTLSGLKLGEMFTARLPLHGLAGVVWHEVMATAVPDREHADGVVHISATDLSDRRAREALMQDDWGLVRQVVDACPDAMGVVDDRLNIVFVNQPFTKWFDVGKSLDLLGRPLATLFSDDEDRATRVRQTKDVLASGKDAVYDIVSPRDGRQISVRTRRITVAGSHYALSVFTDMTEARAAQRATEHAAEVAERGRRRMSEFVATASHELRTPMNGILGMLEPLAEASLASEEAAMVDVAKTSAESLLHLLDDLLEVSRIEAGVLVVEPHDYSPGTLLREVGTVLAPSKSASVTLTIDVADDVPDLVHGDSRRVRQVVSNLVGNALKFTSHGTVDVLCDVPTPDWLRVRVVDTGVGISEDDQARIFDAFSRGRDTRAPGTGLGLAVCSRLVSLLGGRMVVVSSLNKGSDFQAWLPLVAASNASAPQADVRLPRMRVLVVDDNRLNLFVAERMLAMLGHDVVCADSGVEALAVLADDAFDLVLLDLRMPGMDGVATARAVRSLEGPTAETPLVALTAGVSDADQSECHAVGMHTLLLKPLRREPLINVLESVAALRRPSTERRLDPKTVDRLKRVGKRG